MVAKRSVPNEYVHNDALTPETFAQFAGRQLSVPVAAGKPLLASFFSAPRKVFAQEIEQGVRAITIPVDEISSISGMLRAGDRIDFMYVVEKSAANDPSVVIPLLQDVEVRATGQITSEQFAAMRKRSDVSADTDPYAQQRYSTVTVAIQPQDAQKLILAQRLGKIIATLRNPGRPGHHDQRRRRGRPRRHRGRLQAAARACDGRVQRTLGSQRRIHRRWQRQPRCSSRARPGCRAAHRRRVAALKPRPLT
jgi:Flp pilus assembly protein CpaB